MPAAAAAAMAALGPDLKDVRRVKQDTPVRKLAGMLAGVVRQNGSGLVLAMIGPLACNQAVKAVAIVQKGLLVEGVELGVLKADIDGD